MDTTKQLADSAAMTDAAATRARKIAAAGGIVGALGASSCCIAPLLLFSLGVSGAWISNLTRLAPYQPKLGIPFIAPLSGSRWNPVA